MSGMKKSFDRLVRSAVQDRRLQHLLSLAKWGMDMPVDNLDVGFAVSMWLDRVLQEGREKKANEMWARMTAGRKH